MLNDQPLYRLPPQNLEAEESILASCLISPKDCEEIVEILKPEHFYKTAHRDIFAAIVSLYNDKIPVDSVTLTDRLKANDHLERCGGATYIATLINEIPAATNAQHHAKIVIDKATKRSTIQKCHDIMKSCFDDSDPAIDIIDKAQTSILELESRDVEDLPFEPMSSILMDAIDVLDERFLNKGKLTGIPTGFSQIDILMWGLQNTDLIIVAARPSMGKSSFALNIVRHAAIDCEEQFPVGIFSMEMSKQQLSFKLLADLAKINTQKFKSGMFSPKEWESLASVAGKLADAPIYIDDSNALTIHEVRRRSRQMLKQHGIKLIIIDYIQLMAGTGLQNRNLDIGEIANGSKRLAKELNIPVIAISQLNRKVEDRNDKRPQMADLRESGEIESAADVIAFVYRDEMYNSDENNPLRGTGEIIIKKNRTGPTGIARLSFKKEYASFYELAYDDPINY
jgi:replicative DNA helicase